MNEIIKLENTQLFNGNLRDVGWHLVLTAIIVLHIFFTVSAQNNPQPLYKIPENAIVIENGSESDVFDTAGKSVYVKGTITKGVMSFGGDVIVEGRVEGDVATIGGSVYQRSGSFIGGDIIVLGGKYHHDKGTDFRNPEKATVMYTGFQEELRGIMQNPVTLLSPSATPSYFALRIVAILFWFLVSLVLTTIAPGAVSRSVSRLRLSGLRIATIGALTLIIVSLIVFGGLNFLPTPFSAVIGLMILFLSALAYTFGRVAVQAATGNSLLKQFAPNYTSSESVALLLGTLVWTLALSLPYLWIISFLALIIMSLGLILTARSPISWRTKNSEN